jgi:hypothetical protein
MNILENIKTLWRNINLAKKLITSKKKAKTQKV